MGWASGSGMMREMIRVVEKHVAEASKPKVYKELIEIFEHKDCDTLDECLGQSKAFDKVFTKLYPREDDDE